MGVKKTLARLQESFYWPNMLKVVTEFVRECISCQQTKYVTQRPGGLLQPLPLPNRIWEDLSMDFVSGLPMSEGQSVIFVVVDRLSKGAHFGTLAHPYTAYKVAQLFITLIAKLHGMPCSGKQGTVHWEEVPDVASELSSGKQDEFLNLKGASSDRQPYQYVQ
jgi:hypothetical protein